MCVPTLSHTKVAGGPYLLGLSCCLVCPIDSRDEEAKAHPSFICSMQERIHRTMGQRDNCDLTETYGTWCNGPAWDRLGWNDTRSGGERPIASSRRPQHHRTPAGCRDYSRTLVGMVGPNITPTHRRTPSPPASRISETPDPESGSPPPVQRTDGMGVLWCDGAIRK